MAIHKTSICMGDGLINKIFLTLTYVTLSLAFIIAVITELFYLSLFLIGLSVFLGVVSFLLFAFRELDRYWFFLSLLQINKYVIINGRPAPRNCEIYY